VSNLARWRFRPRAQACYSIYQPGASLARHVDEHHEEAKGSGGWALPSRRSVSWLVYLNALDWSARQVMPSPWR
jgi:hypothetical protein